MIVAQFCVFGDLLIFYLSVPFQPMFFAVVYCGLIALKG